MLQVLAVALRQQPVHKFTPQFAAPINELDVIRRDHDGSIFPDMFRYPFVGHLVVRYAFLTLAPKAGYLFCSFRAAFKSARHTKAFFAFLHIVDLPALKIAFGITEIIDRIEQIGFAGPVKTGNAGNRSFKVKGPSFEITELGERYLL